MVRALAAAAALAAACGPAHAPPPAPATPTPTPTPTPTAHAHTCADAGAGLERGTVGVRAPGSTVLAAMRTRCLEDAWPAEAVACFAAMQLDAADRDLSRCATQLPQPARDRMFDTVGSGSNDNRIALALVRARLGALTLPVAACDRFVATVSELLACEHIPLDVRLSLGHQTSDFWSLPTANLAPAAEQHMSDVCSDSLGKLQQRAQDAGCMP
ncbi:MAG: hypothetical protein KIT31_03505 [Deltaproteobacteria bacterium]|nr:hypothetical protein [Deltaproteobacteria bacterium]